MLVWLRDSSNEYYRKKNRFFSVWKFLLFERKVEIVKRKKINFPAERHDIFVSLGKLILVSVWWDAVALWKEKRVKIYEQKMRMRKFSKKNFPTCVEILFLRYKWTSDVHFKTWLMKHEIESKWNKFETSKFEKS